MRDSARRVRETATEEANSVLDSARAAGDHFTEAVRSGVTHLRDTASDYIDHGRDKARDIEQMAEQRISDRPFGSVLMALGLGFLIGFFCTRRG
jgi:ElaB/YqjD/DUF883 family membrane-anchored ribosome-binding protein